MNSIVYEIEIREKKFPRNCLNVGYCRTNSAFKVCSCILPLTGLLCILDLLNMQHNVSVEEKKQI